MIIICVSDVFTIQMLRGKLRKANQSLHNLNANKLLAMSFGEFDDYLCWVLARIITQEARANSSPENVSKDSEQLRIASGVNFAKWFFGIWEDIDRVYGKNYISKWFEAHANMLSDDNGSIIVRLINQEIGSNEVEDFLRMRRR